MSSLTYYIEYHYAGRLHPFGFRLPVNDDVALLGRDPQATVRFYDDTPTVSRRHALIRRQNGQYTRLFHLTLMLQCATVNQVVICSSYAMAVLISFWIKGLMAFN